MGVDEGRKIWACTHDSTVTVGVERSKWESYGEPDGPPITLLSFIARARALGWNGHVRETVAFMFRDAFKPRPPVPPWDPNVPFIGPAPSTWEDYQGEPDTSALPITLFDECRNRSPKKWLLKKAIALKESSTWYGPPGSMKSALLTDICVHIAAGRDWRDRYTSKRACGVVYFAFERADLVKRRLAAYAIRDGFSGLPIAVCDRIIDLLNTSCVEIILATIRDAEATFGIPVGFIVLDTWSKAIAAGGGDENNAKEQNIVAANLRRIHEQIEVHIAGVGHCGKDTSKGERGSNARLGDVDLAIVIEGDDRTRVAKVVKANDQSEGQLTAFSLESVELGVDEDGEAVAAWIVANKEASAPTSKGKRPLSAKQQVAMRTLERVLILRGEDMTFENTTKVRAVPAAIWAEELGRDGALGENPTREFKGLKIALIAAREIVEVDGFIYRPRDGFNLPR